MKTVALGRVSASFCVFKPAGVAVLLGLACSVAQAQTPARAGASGAGTTQLWIDLSTSGIAGLDDSPMMGMFGGMMGNTTGTKSSTGRDGQQAKGVGNFGQTRDPGLGKQIDVALFAPSRSQGTQATHNVPFTGLGHSPLQLITPPREGLSPGPDSPPFERPRGRISFYWGCNAAIKPGQPRVFDMSKLSERDYSAFMTGRSVRDRGARAEPGHAIWPNDQQNSRVSSDASVLGDHSVTGDGVPAGMSFRLTQDFMPRIQAQSQGGLADAINVSWGSVASARAYFLVAFGSVGGDDSADLVIWSSSEPPESGFGLLDYISNANVDKWVGDRVLLNAQTSQCTVPAGIFKNSQGAMLQIMAYGNEVNLSQPKPSGASASWRPEWAVRARYKSKSLVMLGQEMDAGSRNSGTKGANEGAKEDTPNPVKSIGDALKGLFGK